MIRAVSRAGFESAASIIGPPIAQCYKIFTSGPLLDYASGGWTRQDRSQQLRRGGRLAEAATSCVIKSSQRDNVRCSCCASDCLLNHREKIEIKCPYDDRWWEKLVWCILSEKRRTYANGWAATRTATHLDDIHDGNTGKNTNLVRGFREIKINAEPNRHRKFQFFRSCLNSANENNFISSQLLIFCYYLLFTYNGL